MYSSFWYKNFDGMAYKTMLRQLISKWGVMSIDLQSAFERDMTTMDGDGNVTYVENDTEEYVDSTASEPEAKPEPEQGKEETPVIEQSQTTQQNPAAAALFS